MTRAAALLVLCACSHAFTARQFKVRYQHEGEAAPDAPPFAGFSKIDVRDARPDPKLVGERERDQDPNALPLSITNDSSQWVKEGLESRARSAQFLVGDPNHPSMEVTVNTIDLHEKVFSNGAY